MPRSPRAHGDASRIDAGEDDGSWKNRIASGYGRDEPGGGVVGAGDLTGELGGIVDAVAERVLEAGEAERDRADEGYFGAGGIDAGTANQLAIVDGVGGGEIIAAGHRLDGDPADGGDDGIGAVASGDIAIVVEAVIGRAGRQRSDQVVGGGRSSRDEEREGAEDSRIVSSMAHEFSTFEAARRAVSNLRCAK